MGAGSNGIIFQVNYVQVSNQKLNSKQMALKICFTFLQSDHLQFKNNLKLAQEIARRGNPYFKQTEEDYELISINDSEQCQLLAYLMDSGYSLRNPINFPLGYNEEERANLLINYIIQILDAFILLQEQNCLHGDVKPDNLIIVNRRGKEQIMVIDFDFVGNMTETNNQINYQIYSRLYRPFELAFYFQIGNMYNFKPNAKTLYEQNKISKLLLEEAYSVGKTIQKIFEINFFDDEEKIISQKKLNLIYNQVLPNLVSVTQRISLIEAKEFIIDIVEKEKVQIERAHFLQVKNKEILDRNNWIEAKLYYAYQKAESIHSEIKKQICEIIQKKTGEKVESIKNKKDMVKLLRGYQSEEDFQSLNEEINKLKKKQYILLKQLEADTKIPSNYMLNKFI